MTIQLFVPHFRTAECLEAIKECFDKGWTGIGWKTDEIEAEWSKYTGIANSHFINSNTSGLHLAVHIFKTKYGWQDGDEVITTSLTFVSTNHAIMYCNLKPVFADIDQYLCLDPVDVERKITKKTKAVMFVGIGGNTGQYEAVRDICKKYGLKLILDAAHMSGTRLHGIHVGHDADCSVFSFQAVKNLPTADSGMICFREKEDDLRARKLTWLGISKDTYSRSAIPGTYKWMYDVEEVGFKYNGNSVMAAIALVGLKYLDEDNSYRRKLVDLYTQGLQGSGIGIVPTYPDCESSRHLFQILVPDRENFIAALAAKNISVGVHYRDNIHYKMYSYAEGTCPNARNASDSVVSLPLHLGVTEQDAESVIDSVVKAVKALYAQS